MGNLYVTHCVNGHPCLNYTNGIQFLDAEHVWEVGLRAHAFLAQLGFGCTTA